jgi:hypothetical protein
MRVIKTSAAMINWHGEERKEREASGIIALASIGAYFNCSFAGRNFPSRKFSRCFYGEFLDAGQLGRGEVLIWLRVPENMTRLQHAALPLTLAANCER